MNFIKNLPQAAVAFFITVLLFSSCRPVKDVIYFQVPQDTTQKSNTAGKDSLPKDTANFHFYDPIIRQNDILEIFITSINSEAASFFNPLAGLGTSMTAIINDNPEALGYVVDVNGEIELPIIGEVKVAGLTVPMIKDTLKKKLEKYLEKPSVKVTFKNFKVSILGEVKLPGVYTVLNERMTFPEAIAMAGDLTIYGKRQNVMIIREENGKKEFITIDMTQRNFFESPYYFLHPNDVIYVEPVKSKVDLSDSFFRWYPLVLSTLTFIAVLALQ